MEKEIAIAETKKKKWVSVSHSGIRVLVAKLNPYLLQCSYCMKEAQYNCCWNANYCNEACQQAHWPEHMKNCVQIRQGIPTPAAEQPPQTPQSKPSSTQPMGTPTDPQTFVFAPPPRPSSTGGHIIMPHATPPAAMAAQQSPREVGGPSEPMLQYAESAHVDPRPEQPGLDQAMARIEHVPNDNSLINSAHHQASQHMKTLLLQQAAAAQQSQHSLQHHHHQPPGTQQAGGPPRGGQHGTKNSVIAGGGTTLIRHPPSVSLYQPLMAQVVDNAGAGTPRDSSPHRLPPGLPPPTSPGSPASEHSVHNPPGFSWPYQQPVIISSTDGYPMPLLPALQSSGSQQQTPHQSFFKAF